MAALYRVFRLIWIFFGSFLLDGIRKFGRFLLDGIPCSKNVRVEKSESALDVGEFYFFGSYAFAYVTTTKSGLKKTLNECLIWLEKNVKNIYDIMRVKKCIYTDPYTCHYATWAKLIQDPKKQMALCVHLLILKFYQKNYRKFTKNYRSYNRPFFYIFSVTSNFSVV